MDKPPYRVPSMAEIAALEPNGYTCASSFSGAGGSSLGYRMAGFKVAWASEFIPAAREVYLLNASPGTIVDSRDIREVSPAAVLHDLDMKPGDLDLFDGSPPCASFSTAGKRHAGWGQVRKYSDSKQRSDDLFFEFVRMIDGIQPKVFVGENVSGLLKGSAKGYFRMIMRAMKEAGPGYRVAARLLDAQWLGVPQARRRVIFIGVRSDLGLDPVHPSPLPYRYTIRDALPNVADYRFDTQGNFKVSHYRSDEGVAATITTQPGHHSTATLGDIVAVGTAPAYGEEEWADPDRPVGTLGTSDRLGNYRSPPGHVLVVRDEQGDILDPETGANVNIGRFSIGPEWSRLKQGESSPKYYNLIRPDTELPVPTVTAKGGASGAASVTHPVDRRKFTIAELRRLCGFPDDFQLSGTYGQRWERLGRAVPPVMMSHIAKTIASEILDKAYGKEAA